MSTTSASRDLSMSRPLQAAYPWTSTPIIANAPMGGFAGSALATAVTQAGGVGFIGTAFDMDSLSKELEQASSALRGAARAHHDSTIPVGVGFLTFVAKLDEAAAVIAKYPPAIVWLFAAKELEDYALWAQKIRSVSPQTKIWIQIGSVAGALEVARRCAPDVLVMQGLDAGGHGFEKGAGIISLLPEAADTLRVNGFGHVPLVAAGGIVDGRGVAAALALGADGVVMGTRFLASTEITLPHEGYRAALLETKDGGQNTIRAKVFDELKGPNIWPVLYDGRGIVTESYTDHIGGMDIEEIRRLHKEAVEGEDAGFGIEGRRAAVWAGTGVGLVSEIKAAGDIVEEVREAARKAMEEAKARM